jgi:hypothetical protein
MWDRTGGPFGELFSWELRMRKDGGMFKLDTNSLFTNKLLEIQ